MDYITKNKVQISYMDFRGLCVRWAKNEIKGIYKGFNQFMENTLGATVGQAKKLMNNLMSEVKEFVKGGEFEKIHRNETKTRDRDELSR